MNFIDKSNENFLFLLSDRISTKHDKIYFSSDFFKKFKFLKMLKYFIKTLKFCHSRNIVINEILLLTSFYYCVS